jgi:hypothetical protein
MATMYRKTAKGHSEIETRALRLPPRLRSALILVDGRRSDFELRKLILQQPDETLRSLSEQGLIEAIGIAQASRDAMPQFAATVAPSTATNVASAAPVRSFEATRADAVRAFTDLVGPMAEALAIRMERARSHEELRPLVQTAQAVIGNSRGAQAAAD